MHLSFDSAMPSPPASIPSATLAKDIGHCPDFQSTANLSRGVSISGHYG